MVSRLLGPGMTRLPAALGAAGILLLLVRPLELERTKTLGLITPQSMLLRADEVIQ